MKQEKPIYCIKSVHGRVETEGDFAAIVGWLHENRINSDDDLRRLGYAVLEKDELWARVKDFPEFGLSAREGRQALGKAVGQAKLLKWLGVAAFAVGCGLIAWNQAWPRYEESEKVADSKQEAEDAKVAADQVKAVADTAMKDAVRIKDAAKKVEDDSKKVIAELTIEINRAKVDKSMAIRDRDATQAEKDRALATVAEQISSATDSLAKKLNAETADRKKLSAQLAEIRETLPLLCRYHWTPALFGRDAYEFGYLNYSTETLNVRFKITRADGSVLERSFKVPPRDWLKLDIDGYNFHEGDLVTLVPVDEFASRFKAVAYICPKDKGK
jgi:hypothetical protein